VTLPGLSPVKVVLVTRVCDDVLKDLLHWVNLIALTR
jgi:hypothetical protein